MLTQACVHAAGLEKCAHLSSMSDPLETRLELRELKVVTENFICKGTVYIHIIPWCRVCNKVHH